MGRRLRNLLVVAGVFAMVLVLSVGSAFAHPNSGDETEAPAAGKAKAFEDCASDIDPLFCAPISKGGGEGVFGVASGNAIDGIFKGFVNHSPMCTEHYYESLGGQDHGNEP